ncbi:MAG: MFS transporter [Chloroflexota bacterium]
MDSTTEKQHVDWRTFTLVGLILGITQLGFFLTAAALPLYLHDHGAPQNRVGLDVGAGNISSVVALLLLGPLMDRFGPRRFLQLGGIVYIMSSVGMLIFPHEIPITGFRVLQGVGAVTIPSAMAIGIRMLSSRPGTALGSLGMVISLSLAIGPPVGLALYSSGGSVPLFVGAGSAGAIGLFLTLFVRDVAGKEQPRTGFAFRRAWIPSYALSILSNMYFGGIVAYLPLHLRGMHGPNAGIFFTADALGVLLLRIPTGILADRYGTLLPKLAGVIITLPGIAVLAMHPSISTLVISGAATGIGAGLFVTGILADLGRLSTEANRGTALSLGTASFSSATFVGSAISGLLITWRGFGAILVFGLATTVLALPFVVTRDLTPHIPKREAEIALDSP